MHVLMNDFTVHFQSVLMNNHFVIV